MSSAQRAKRACGRGGVCGAVPVSGATPKDAARAPAPEANGGRGGRGHDGGRRGRSYGEGGRAASGAGEALDLELRL